MLFRSSTIIFKTNLTHIPMKLVGDNILPGVDLATDIGSPSLHFKSVYANMYYGSGAQLTGIAANLTAGVANSIEWTNVQHKPTKLSEFQNDPGYITGVDWSIVANKPTKVSAFQNDSGYLTSVDWSMISNTPDAVSSLPWTSITGKPTKVSVFQNDAGYLTAIDWSQVTGKPTNVTAFQNDAGYITGLSWSQLTGKPTKVSAFQNDSGYITSNDLPVMPTKVSAFQNDAGYITSANLPGMPSIPQAFPSGTRLLFQQTSAPTGWTKDTNSSLNDSIIRIVTGSVGNGGSTAFSTFNSQSSVGATTLTVQQVPSHSHTATSTVVENGHYHLFPGDDQLSAADGKSGWTNTWNDTFAYDATSQKSGGGKLYRTTTQTSGMTVSTSVGSTGGGGSHTHGVTINIKYYDVIIASKD